MQDRVDITLTVNGWTSTVRVPPAATLASLLRDDLGLTGTKVGCGEGECGACSVLLDGLLVNSCLVPAAECEGAEVLTIEGLGKEGKLHPIQEAFVRCGAIQCGFCTPGMIMAAYALLKENPNPTEEEIRRGLEGNICRCTGYRKIIDAVAEAARTAPFAGDGRRDAAAGAARTAPFAGDGRRDAAAGAARKGGGRG